MNTFFLPTIPQAIASVDTPERPFQKSYIKSLFDTMSASYEAMNYLTSFGFSYLWRKQFLKALPTHDAPVEVADLMTGMGETWPHIFSKWKNARLTALDFSAGMLHGAAKRNQHAYGNQVRLLQEDVLQSHLPSGHFDVVTCAFGLKTLDKAQMQELAQEIFRILKPNGQFAFVEVSEPPSNLLRGLYLYYLKHIIPVLGQVFAKEYEVYKLLGFYTKAFGNAREAAAIFKATGLSVTYQSFFNGCATGFYGSK